MPIFEYKCSDCGTVFEKLISGNISKTFDCPNCSSDNTDKKLSVFGGIVMGSSKQTNCASAPTCGMAGTGCGGHCH